MLRNWNILRTFAKDYGYNWNFSRAARYVSCTNRVALPYLAATCRPLIVRVKLSLQTSDIL